MTKLNLTVLCGGQSSEHEISVISASNILKALDTTRYHIQVIYITKTGEFRYFNDWKKVLDTVPLDQWDRVNDFERVTPYCGNPTGHWLSIDAAPKTYRSDVVFPMLHGEHGEDGDMQGLLEILNLPYVGAGVLSSAICMDKAISKAIFKEAGIPVADYRVCHREELETFDFKSMIKDFGFPLFVKPANTGSSVGVSKAYDETQLKAAIELALQYDVKLIFERYVKIREIECAVLGNFDAKVALPGELVIHHDFYTYEAKYLDPNGATPEIPANITAEQTKTIQALALKAFRAMDCRGFARIDFFLTESGECLLNELNTLPGFTSISMYPKMWRAAGLSYPQLLNRLIELALENKL